MIIDLAELTPAERQAYLQTAIAPRPICLASTINSAGEVNLSPFSFFNMFSANPPVIVFSPSRRVRDNTTKHTLQNILDVPEVVVHVVDYDIVQQVSLSSCEYPAGVNEFEKAGFTMEKATIVKPPMVKEAKIKMECRVLEVKELGQNAGAGNLVIAEVLRMHIDDAVLNSDKKIDQNKIRHVARLGGDWYCRVDEQSLFAVPKPNTHLGMGIDQLPANIRNSRILTGNHLGILANFTEVPAANPSFTDEAVTRIMQYYSLNPDDMDAELQQRAAQLLDAGDSDKAWQVLLAGSI